MFITFLVLKLSGSILFNFIQFSNIDCIYLTFSVLKSVKNVIVSKLSQFLNILSIFSTFPVLNEEGKLIDSKLLQ